MKLFFILHTGILSILLIGSSSSFARVKNLEKTIVTDFGTGESEKTTVPPAFSVVEEQNLTSEEAYTVAKIFYNNGLLDKKRKATNIMQEFQQLIYNNHAVGRSAQKFAEELKLHTPFEPSSAKVVIQFYRNMEGISAIPVNNKIRSVKTTPTPMEYLLSLLNVAHILPFKNSKEILNTLEVMKIYSTKRAEGFGPTKAIIQAVLTVYGQQISEVTCEKKLEIQTNPPIMIRCLDNIFDHIQKEKNSESTDKHWDPTQAEGGGSQKLL